MLSSRSFVRAAIVTGTAFAALTAAPPATAQMQPMQTTDAQVRSMIASWPMSSQKAAMDMMQKYGPPQEVTPTMLMWHNNGPWAHTVISNVEVPHSFPIPHPDVMKQTVNYDVPVDKYDDMAAYDGSVILERTKGTLSARCDKEGANFLAVNLAHDVATGRRNVADARAYYARAIDAFMKTNTMDPYMQGLRFQSVARAGDTDRPAATGMGGPYEPTPGMNGSGQPMPAPMPDPGERG